MKEKKNIIPFIVSASSLAIAVVAIILLINKNNDTSMLLGYRSSEGQKRVSVLVHTSQMLQLYNGTDYCLITFKGIGPKKFTYKYRFYDGKLKKETVGEGEVSEHFDKESKQLQGENRVRAGSFDFMWSPRGSKELFYVYIIPDKFDMRLLMAEKYSEYPYYKK